MAPADAAPYLLSLLGLSADTDHLARLSPQAIKARTFAALQQVCLSSSRQQVLVLAVENLHWIDPTSEEWLTAMVESLVGAAILLLVTYRLGYRPAWLAHSSGTQLALPRLTADDSLVLMQSVPQAEQIPERLQQAIVGKAAGNPFFLEELTRAVGARSSEHATLGIPGTIQAVLAARIDRLPPVTKRVLQAAAVIGSKVAVPLLQAITQVPTDTLAGSLRHLQTAEFLYATRLVPEPAYTFTHALTQEVAYASLLHERRRAVHAQIVDVLERRDPDRLREPVDQLAHHAFHGERWDRAVTYCRQAGAKAQAREANWEAVTYFEQALVGLAHLPESRETGEQLIDVHLALLARLWRVGELPRMLDHLHQAETLARALGDQKRLGAVFYQMSFYCNLTGERERAIEAGEHALTIAQAGADLPLKIRTNLNLGRIYLGLGDYPRAMTSLRWNVAALDGDQLRERFGERFGSAREIAFQSRTWLAKCLAELGAFGEGIALAEEVMQVAEGNDNPFIRVAAYRDLGYVYLRQGDLDKAIPVLERGLSGCRAASILGLFPTMASLLGAAYGLAGCVAEALPLLEQAVAHAVSMRLMGDQALSVTWLGEAYLLAGRLEEAHTCATQACDVSSAYKARGYQAYALHLLGDIQTCREPAEVDPAEASYRQALALAEELGMRPLQAHCHLGLGILCTQVDRPAQARAELSSAIALYRAMEMTFWLPRAEAALAGVAESGLRDRGAGSEALNARRQTAIP
jgi:tetratricopeptide (TPR) repeat protein